MTVEEIRGNGDNFPVGLRVLAVDDDPISLKLLETLLRQCQYHVAAMSQAKMAMEMLSENKYRFDLVITDVHMPDIDGFKLLELGLELDIPVVMLSANGDPKLIVKGITRGACDYLVKPIRIEEVRNIWKHLLRRKNCDPNNQTKSSDQVKSPEVLFNGNRKDGEENENDCKDPSIQNNGEENENNCNDPSRQNKPRFIWTVEFHKKFVEAINILGIEVAIPEQILDLMNVDGLTQEIVAIHLKMYKLYLRRLREIQTLPNVALSPYSATVQPSQAQSLSN
ncbi:hypothetical protein ABFS82_11G035800 [Erythranthe guttata]|uniref:Response regulatory domain-containing protein n=1 Tax=Erythranthe guttata TaxID=4155 RepID=A0A022QV47_ERYGU|nr:PREDICTED: two-component response regulator ARR12-like isoform X1 [Erythranthe guttata]EYU31786.1 hypothetical protein MIMGU_mgv1a011483mg [Erythranthe guttata]|eukprot:XP_012844137.1 PREDICTED: two-component response regulator ARR12-like isoform X1 [Erythranthe guttata]